MDQRIVLAVGLPGCGKSTYFRELQANPLSSDDMRRLLVDDTSDQSVHTDVFETIRFLLRRRLRLGRPVTYIDATNLSRRDRRPYIEIARQHGCEIDAIFFDIPFALCQERNAERERVVPQQVLQLMAARLIPPSLEEGFNSISIRNVPEH